MVKSGHRGGAGKCLACALPLDQQERLNADLVKGVPLNRLSKRWNINRESLRSHKTTHITPALKALRTERIASGVRKVADRVEDLVTETQAMYGSAKKAVNMSLALKAVHEQRANYELLARITGELDEKPEVVVNIQQSAPYIAVRNVIFEVLEPHPEIRAEISRRLRLLADNAIPD
jgi:hypothetical protein